MPLLQQLPLWPRNDEDRWTAAIAANPKGTLRSCASGTGSRAAPKTGTSPPRLMQTFNLFLGYSTYKLD